MATYEKVSRSIPSPERAAVITSVEAGDRIDLVDVLGRPARTLIFIVGDSTDVIEYKINSLVRTNPTMNRNETVSDVLLTFGRYGHEQDLTWGARGDTFTATGNVNLQSIDGLRISSIEILSFTSSDSDFTINCT